MSSPTSTPGQEPLQQFITIKKQNSNQLLIQLKTPSCSSNQKGINMHLHVNRFKAFIINGARFGLMPINIADAIIRELNPPISTATASTSTVSNVQPRRLTPEKFMACFRIPRLPAKFRAAAEARVKKQKEQLPSTSNQPDIN